MNFTPQYHLRRKKRKGIAHCTNHIGHLSSFSSSTTTTTRAHATKNVSNWWHVVAFILDVPNKLILWLVFENGKKRRNNFLDFFSYKTLNFWMKTWVFYTRNSNPRTFTWGLCLYTDLVDTKTKSRHFGGNLARKIHR